MSEDRGEDATDDLPVVSERVQLLAKSIYDELEGLVNEYGPNTISSLMPLVVNVLESLDSALSDNQDHLNAVMELSDENQQLLSQYEKEKHRRREVEEKAMQLEENSEDELSKLRDKISQLNVENKSLVTKLRNTAEQIERQAERNDYLMKEHNELLEKNRELIRFYHGQMESLKEKSRLAEVMRVHDDDIAESSSPKVRRAPGYQDFTSPTSEESKKKRRQQPIIPRRPRARAFTQDDDEIVGITPAVRSDSPEFPGFDRPLSPHNTTSLADECAEDNEQQLVDDYIEEEGLEEMVGMSSTAEDFPANEQSLLAEMSGVSSNFPGIEDILIENKSLHSEKEELTRKVENLNNKVLEVETDKSKTENERDNLSQRVTTLDEENRRLRKELNEEKTKRSLMADEAVAKPERISRLEIAKVLRERNEWKEKYFSLLEQVRMNDELYLFRKKEKKSRWLDYFTALFSTTRRKQLEMSLADSSPHRPIFTPANAGMASTESEEPEQVEFLGAGYNNTKIIPTLRKVGKKEDELYLTSVSWVMPSLTQADTPVSSPTTGRPLVCPNINTCRPMSFQEEGAKILCASAITPVLFLEECKDALLLPKESQTPGGKDELSRSMVWICTGNENLTKVSIMDAGAVGEVMETFAVSSNAVVCMAVAPGFDECDPDVLSSLSSKTRQPQSAEVQNALNERPSSKLATVWMGTDTGVLYVHSAVSQWRKCIHADKLPAGIRAIVHCKGKALLLLQNASVAIFLRFSDGEWDWDNYEMVTLSQKKNVPVTAMAAVKYSVWCAIGNTVHVLHTHHLKCEGAFSVHSRRHAEVQQMLNIGEGVWVSFKGDSVIRLFHATSFTHMQDLDISSQVHRVLVFGSEKRSSRMPVMVSCLTAAHNSLWVGTENGVILTFPFNRPTIVAEETGWEVMKEAEVPGKKLPEPFDVKTEQALDASISADSSFAQASVPPQAEEDVLSKKAEAAFIKSKRSSQQPFNPFCNVDQVQVSIHCHANAVICLITIPGMVQSNVGAYEPLGGVYIGSGDKSACKPALFVMSCGGGHLDLRTADKVMQTIHAQEAGRAGVPTAASVISDKNYVMVWDIVA